MVEKNLVVDYLDASDFYWMRSIDSEKSFQLVCQIAKDGSPDQLDFEANHKQNCRLYLTYLTYGK